MRTCYGVGHGAYEEFSVGGFLVVLALGVVGGDSYLCGEVGDDEVQVVVLAEGASGLVGELDEGFFLEELVAASLEALAVDVFGEVVFHRGRVMAMLVVELRAGGYIRVISPVVSSVASMPSRGRLRRNFSRSLILASRVSFSWRRRRRTGSPHSV